jgi:hypothetical protein
MVLLNDGLDRTYTVLNDQGLVLLICRDQSMAKYVSDASKGVAPDVRIIVGGDKGTRPMRPIWEKQKGK